MFTEEDIVPGVILYIKVLLPHDDEYKDKYLIVVCDEPLLFLKINSYRR